MQLLILIITTIYLHMLIVAKLEPLLGLKTK